MATKTGNKQETTIPMVCRSCEARHKGVCGALTADDLTELSKHTSKHYHKPGDLLITPGECIEHYSIVLSGVVKNYKILPDGRQQIVGLQFAPDFLGRPFKDENTIYADAATDVLTCSFPKSVLETIMERSPKMEHLLHMQTLKELDEARDWMLTLGRKNAQEKLASFLVLIANNYDPDDASRKNIRFVLPLKRADIADFLGLTIETVSRQISNLRKHGYINYSDTKEVIVIDLDRLEDLAQDGC